MVWFLVDDKAHANTKIRKVLAEEPAALALWTVAGSWVADELNDGFVPDSQLPWLMPAGAEELAQKLVAARLWKRVRGGYQFHEWTSDGDGSKRNPSREEVLEKRAKRAEAGRKGGLSSGKTRSNGEANASANAQANAKQKRTHTVPTPYQESSSNSLTSSEPEGWAEFWPEFPRKDGRKEALDAYVKAMKRGVDPTTMIEGAKLYAARMKREGRDRAKIKMGQGWINNDRWEDEQAEPEFDPYAPKSLWDN